MTEIQITLTYSGAQHWMFFESAEHGRFRLFPKGRRLGFTRGAAMACIEYCLDGKTVLWGDTVAANIDKYIDRLFMPIILKNKIPHKRHKQLKFLELAGGYIDFRSADRPENWEGFGYDIIILNEAGIILQNRYLYENAVLPMLIDSEHSQLIAGGTPKIAQGKGLLFDELIRKAEEGIDDYHSKTFSTYANPFISREQIMRLAEQIPAAARQQEIYGARVINQGEILQRDWFKRGTPKGIIRKAMGVDLGITQKATSSWTAVVVAGQCEDGGVFILDVERRKCKFSEILAFIEDKATTWNVDCSYVEATQFQLAVVQELLRNTFLSVKPVYPRGSKFARFLPVALRYEQGLIVHSNALPMLKSYNDSGSVSFEDELLTCSPTYCPDVADAEVHCLEGLLGKGHIFTFASGATRETASIPGARNHSTTRVAASMRGF